MKGVVLMDQMTLGATNLQVCRLCLGMMSYGAKKLTGLAISGRFQTD
jgi:aryl-alcohol dehydrogenase-like predicted oxidoreductase